MIDLGSCINLYKEGMAQKEEAQGLDTTQGYVSKMLYDNDVDTGFTKWWEDDEVEFLKKNYPPESEEDKEKLVEKLCVEGRTWTAVRNKAGSLGLTRPQDEYRKSEANRRTLQKATRRIKIGLDHLLVEYVVGVLDTDGYTNMIGQIGLEAGDREFIEKFRQKLEELGFNPRMHQSPRSADRDVLYACSWQFVQ